MKPSERDFIGAESKPKWGPGEWQDEPDEAEWVDEMTGYACHAKRGPFGHWCGYVGITKSHPWFGKQYDGQVKVPDHVKNRAVNIDEVGALNLLLAALDHNPETFEEGYMSMTVALDAHGGITFTAEDKGLWWFGFDCGHSGDISPGLIALLNATSKSGVTSMRCLDIFGAAIYRNLNYVKLNCHQLAEQLKQFDCDKT